MIMKTEDLAYIAGMLDADGWIGISHRSDRYSFTVGIVNRDREVLAWIQVLFGGALRPRKFEHKSKAVNKWSQTYDWTPDGKGVKRFLESVRPYLRIKAKQADIVLAFLDTRLIKTGIQKGHGRAQKCEAYKLPPEILREREQMYQTTKSLNAARPLTATVQ